MLNGKLRSLGTPQNGLPQLFLEALKQGNWMPQAVLDACADELLPQRAAES